MRLISPFDDEMGVSPADAFGFTYDFECGAFGSHATDIENVVSRKAGLPVPFALGYGPQYDFVLDIGPMRSPS